MHGMVSIDASRAANGMLQISVADSGPGILDAKKGKILGRFYRGDTSRGTPGVGLGPILVAAVGKLHGGTLLLSDQHPALKVTLRCDN
jgi:signal transduction histidine kinase